MSLWTEALGQNGGPNLARRGITTGLVYWADVLYGDPLPPQTSRTLSDTSLIQSGPDPDMSWRDKLTGDEKVWVNRLAERWGVDLVAPDGDDAFEPPPWQTGELNTSFARLPLPWWLKQRLMRWLLRDVHHYLFNAEHQSDGNSAAVRVQDEIRRRFVDVADQAKSHPHIVIGHSMGSVIAYDCLKRVSGCPAIDGLVTIGSPLGLGEIQAQLEPEWTRSDGFPTQKVLGPWVNVFDRLDLVSALDPRLANDYQKRSENVIDDINEQNWGRWRHRADRYLAGPRLRNRVATMLEFADA